jgi:hypothetical protein
MNKLTYQKPELTQLGSAEQLTHADYKAIGFDGIYGSYSYTYQTDIDHPSTQR